MRYLFIVFLLICQSLHAQIDKPEIFGSFPFSDDYRFNYILKVKCIGDYYYFMVSHIHNEDVLSYETAQFSIIKTDTNFNVIDRVKTLKVGNDIQNFSYFIYVDKEENYVLLAGNQFKEDKTLYNIFKLNLRTLEVHRTDSIVLTADLLYNVYFKQINDSTLIAFGQTQGENGLNQKYVATKVSTSGKVLQFKEVEDAGHGMEERSIIGFEYLEDPELYFVNVNSENYLVYDKELNLIQKVNERFYAPEIKLMNTNVDARFIRAENGYIHCVGRMPTWGKQYGITHLRLPIIGDSIGDIDQIDPLLPPGSNVLYPEYVFPAVDAEGNLLVVLDDQFSYPGAYWVDTTTLYIIKTNLEDYGYRSNEWFITFNNGTEMSVWAADTDENGDFIIAGGYRSEEIIKEVRRWRNFYLKVQADGTITSVKGFSPDNIMVVYPNPTYGSVSLKAENSDVHSYAIYDIQGRLLKRAEINNSRNIDMYAVDAGTYFLVIRDRNGKIIGKSKIVKY